MWYNNSQSALERVHITCIRRSNPAPGREWLRWLGWSFLLCAMLYAISFWFCKTAINGNNRPELANLDGYFGNISNCGSRPFPMCSFYFYDTRFFPVCQGAGRIFLRGCGLTVFDGMCYNHTQGHTENGGRFDFQLPCTLYDGRWYDGTLCDMVRFVCTSDILCRIHRNHVQYFSWRS